MPNIVAISSPFFIKFHYPLVAYFFNTRFFREKSLNGGKKYDTPQYNLIFYDKPYQPQTCPLHALNTFIFTSVHFAFGDSTSCGYNYCRKKYTRGLYTAIGTASNDLFQANQQRTIIACPNTPVTVTYTPGIFNGGIGIEYLGERHICNI